jgi:polysaccharide export outer membrane protein
MRFFKYFLFLSVVLSFSSCKVFRSNLMLKTPKDYAYDKLNDSLTSQDYRLAANDIITVKIFSNDGFKIIDLANATQNYQYEINYVLDRNGRVKLPLVGDVPLAGLTIRESETFLEQVYDTFYVKPFVSLKVINRRVIVFPGNGGKAQVVQLTNNNTTVIEVLALTGGIAEDGKAYKVKLIRNEDKKKPQVFLMDLSEINGLTAGNTVVMANDIVYVEPRYRFAKTLVGEITPLLTLLSSTLLLYTLIRR